MKRTKKNRLLKNAAQFCLCFFITGVILNFLLYGYYRRPPKIVVQAATDKIWASDKLIIDRTEGFGTVRTDANGYNNLFVPSDVDNYILLIGSSHTQAINVNQNENYAYLLTQKLQQAGIDTPVYNIGFDANEFVVIIEHFKAAMQQFEDAEAIIIEIYKVDYSPEKLLHALNKQITYDPGVGYGIQSLPEKTINFLQSLPLARLVYSRLDTFRPDIENAFIAKFPETAVAEEEECPPGYQEAVNAVMATFKQQAQGKEIILLYNPMMSLEKDGSMTPEPYQARVDAIARACADEGIYFHDMTESFLNLYTGQQQSAHGFSNSKIVIGHLNPHGHRAIAEDLYGIICAIWHGEKK